MTILDVRNMFTTDTEIFIKGLENKSPILKITNVLMGCTAFNSMAIFIKSIKAIAENQIEITLDIPLPILKAWKKYSDNFYSKNN